MFGQNLVLDQRPWFAAKSLQSCPTLCDPRDVSPPGSPIPGILQARTLEWVAISFSNAWKWKVKVKVLSRVRLFATPWTAAYQAPPSMGLSRQEYWSGVPLPSLEALVYQVLKRNTKLLGIGRWWGRKKRLSIKFITHELKNNSKRESQKNWQTHNQGQEEKGTTEDEMDEWHHWLDGCESEWTPGVCDGQGSLVYCDSWGCKESDTTEWLNWLNNQMMKKIK